MGQAVVRDPEGLHAATTMAMSPAARPAPPRRWPAALAWALAGLAVLALPPALRLEQLLRAARLPGPSRPAPP